MVLSMSRNTRCHSPGQLLVAAAIIGFFYLKVPCATSLNFSFSTFNPNDPNITLTRDASVSGDGILLTINQLDKNLNFSKGRITYAHRLYLWNKESKNLTNFHTSFSFTINSMNKKNYGDGMAFFLIPPDFQYPEAVGGGFGLVKDDKPSPKPFVAVEFDTYKNEWDPPYYHNGSESEHVGIDINSIRSNKSVEWYSSIMNGTRNNASISYDSASKNLSVTFTNFLTGSSWPVEQSLSCVVDLTAYLPEWVQIGFAAATGASFEIHTLHSWSFSSDLEFEKPNHFPPASPPIPIEEVPVTDPPTKRPNKEAVLVVGLSVGGFVFLIGLLSLFFWIKKRREKDGNDNVDIAIAEEDHFDFSMDDDFEKDTGPRKFTYDELARATENFSQQQKLGEGGFGSVYRGYLRKLNSYVAVKRVSSGSKQGVREYASEVKIISRLRHRNLVQLIGWCHEKKELLLVYEFLPNGSLDSHLFKQDSLLSWDFRYKIVRGLASGLFYLQEEWEQCVLHRDIKSSNIMLDSDFNAKLGDFGLARLVDHGKGPQTTILAGTMGYMAPECVITGKASRESDVYSFGIVAFEIACGRKPIDRTASEDQVYMKEWVWSLYGQGNSKVLEAADPRLNGDFDEQQMIGLMIVGLWCVHPDPMSRPSIRRAIQALNFEIPLPDLPSTMPVAQYFPPLPFSLSLEVTGGQNQSSSYSNTASSSQFTASSSDSSSSVLLMHTR